MKMVLALTLFTALTANAEKWNSSNDPAIMDPNFVYQLARLPLEGRLDTIPWSETYWPSKQGSINIRWNQETPQGFDYRSPTRDEVGKMSREQLARLSPSEKYDIFMGRYDYPLRQRVSGIATRSAKWWSGICDGWSWAALSYVEPKAIDAKNADGVTVPFGASDIKGLLSYTAMSFNDVETRQVGGRCTGAGRIFGVGACSDINAGALHVILANQIGLKKQGFVTERDPGNQIWNQPTYGFKFELVGSTRNGVRVKGQLIFADELEKSEWTPVVGTEKFVEGKLNMEYELDLDSNGNIVGGDFISGDRPDFVWLPMNRPEFKDEMAGLKELYVPNTL